VSGQPPLLGVVRYMVTHMLAGNVVVVRSIYEVLGQNDSPSMIVRRYGLSKHAVKGYIQRIVERCGSRRRAEIIVSRVGPIVLGAVEPIVVDDGNVAVCKLCMVCSPDNARMVNDPSVRYSHVRRLHKAVVEMHIRRVLDELRAQVAGHGGGEVRG